MFEQHVLAAVLSILALAAGAVPAQEGEGEYEPRPQGTVTWAGDVASIVYEHCTPCHHPGSLNTPFPLTSYSEARRRARVIGRVIQEDFMPPSLPDPAVREYANARTMSAEEKGLLMQWAREGGPKGEESEIPPAPDFGEEWTRGEPDLVLQAKESYTLPLDAFDVTRNFVFPLELDESRWIAAVALRPTSKAVLRALLFVDPSGETADADPEDLAAVIDAKPELGFFPVAGLGGEIVEGTPWSFPSPFLLRQGSSIVVQVYFQATGEEEEERPQLGLYFAADPPQTPMVTLSLGTAKLELPAGEKTTVTSSFELPVGAEIVGVLPHAHRLAKEIEGWATLPDGAKEPLLEIDAWDFAWQKPYWFAEPLEVPAGTVIEMRFVYDNTEDNFNNPNYPPAPVSWGQTLGGEMAGLHVRLLVDRDGLETLRKAYRKYAGDLGL